MSAGINKATKFWLILGLIYLLLQLFSLLIQWTFPYEPKPHPEKRTTEIITDDGTIGFEYLRFGNSGSLPAVVLLPDLFGGEDETVAIAHKISESRETFVLLYPERNVDGDRISHSVNSRSSYIASLLNALELEEYHLVANGYGGAVLKSGGGDGLFSGAMSFSFIESVGVQEFEFLGGHRINSSIFSMLVPLHGFLKYIVPHAGWYYQQPVNQNFVRSMNQLDLREIRDLIKNIEEPVTILTSKGTDRVRRAAAQEHHRLIPQSELSELEFKEKSISERAVIYSTELLTFFDRTEAGESLTRSDAPAERIEQSEKPFDPDDTRTAEGLALLILILLIASITLVSEDLACIAGGLAVAGGFLGFWHAVLAVFVGIFTADIIVYWLGRGIGSPALKWIPFRWLIKEKDILWAEHMFDKNGLQIIFASRFLPGTRFPVYFSAGMVKSHFGYFALYFFSALIVWAPLIIGITTLVGQRMLVYLDLYQEYAVLILLVLVILIFFSIKLVMPLATKKGRREFAVKIIRLKERYFDK